MELDLVEHSKSVPRHRERREAKELNYSKHLHAANLANGAAQSFETRREGV